MQVSAELDVSSIPMLPGAAECAAAGVLSSLHSQNAKASAAVENPEQAIQHESWPLLVDPQTGDWSICLLKRLGVCMFANMLFSIRYSYFWVECERVNDHHTFCHVGVS